MMHKVVIIQDGMGGDGISIDGHPIYCQRVQVDWGIEKNELPLPTVTLTILGELTIELDEAEVTTQ